VRSRADDARTSPRYPIRPETERFAMTAAPSLDEDRLQRLSELLDRRAVPFGGFNLEALDGYLSALMVGPEDVPASEWQVGIFGDKPPRWESAEEAADVESLLMGHWNLVAARVRQSEPKAEYLYPLIWLPETEDSEDLERFSARAGTAQTRVGCLDRKRGVDFRCLYRCDQSYHREGVVRHHPRHRSGRRRRCAMG
jgi:hypothetical protein